MIAMTVIVQDAVVVSRYRFIDDVLAIDRSSTTIVFGIVVLQLVVPKLSSSLSSAC